MAVLILVPSTNASAAKALSKSDFVYKMNGKKNFYKVSNGKDKWGNKYTTYYTCLYKITDKSGYSTGNIKKISTNRNIKWGSSASTIIKKYGKATKVKYSKKDTFHKCLKYYITTIDTSAWKSYLEYTYKEGDNEYKIRFYLNKKNKVTAVAYLKNLSEFYSYPDKEVNAGLTFKAPSGKKVTKKTIGGKKVYIVPKGTTVYCDESKANISWLDYSVEQYGVDGKKTAASDLEGFSFGKEYKIEDVLANCYKWNQKKDTSTGKKINIKKLGKYRYFTITVPDIDGTDGVDLAPQIIYIRLK